MRFALFTLLMLLPGHSSAADNGCLLHDAVVDRIESWDLTNSARADFYLPTQSTFGLNRTAAAAHVEWNGQIDISFDHFLPPGQTGLAYTVHRMVIQVGADEDENKFIKDLDLTHGCNDPGRSFFPGESVKITPIKIPERQDGQPRGFEPIRIQVWGHL